MYVLYLYMTSIAVGFFILESPQHVSNTLHYDITMATRSLGDRNFLAPL